MDTIQYKRKVVFVGDAGVGKTVYRSKLTSKPHPDTTSQYIPTMGTQVQRINFRIDSQQMMELDIWDCAGVEEYRGLFQSYYSGANGVIIFIDNNKSAEEKEESFVKWQKEISNVSSNLPFVVVYTKFDLTVDGGIPMGTADQNSTYYQVSSTRGDNVHLPIKSLINKLLKTTVRSMII